MKYLAAYERVVLEVAYDRIDLDFVNFQEKEIPRLAGTVPNQTTKGEIENMAMYAGEGVGLIHEILPASEVVKRLVEGAQTLIYTKFNDV